MLIQLLIIIQSVLCILGSEKVCVDTDAGADDAIALLLLFGAWDNNDTNYEVIAITCVNGNTGEDNIPVYGGAQKPLMKNARTDNFFGNDGFGDFEFKENITAKVNESIHAAVALIELAKKYPGELNILCLGPLTNIALAAALDPSFMKNVKKFFCMGGSTRSIGNMSPGVEFNAGIDPDSMSIVFNSARNYTKYEPNMLVSWEPILDAAMPMDWRQSVLGTKNSKFMKFLNQAERISISKSGDAWGPADPFAAACMMWPSDMIKKSVITNVTPVTDGAARGTLLVDYSNNSSIGNTEVVMEMSTKYFQRKLLKHLS